MAGNSEIEVVFYAKIGNRAGLEQAPEIEDHVQLETRLLEGNKIRVRKTVKGGGEPTYVFTGKRKSKAPAEDGAPMVQSSTEFSAPVDAAFFEAFEGMCEQRIEKRRYIFRNQPLTLTLEGQETPVVIENACFEVDQFMHGGAPTEYVKIDIEVDYLQAFMAEHYPGVTSYNITIKQSLLPFEPFDSILMASATDEQKQLIEELWKTQFSQRLN